MTSKSNNADIRWNGYEYDTIIQVGSNLSLDWYDDGSFQMLTVEEGVFPSDPLVYEGSDIVNFVNLDVYNNDNEYGYYSGYILNHFIDRSRIIFQYDF